MDNPTALPEAPLISNQRLEPIPACSIDITYLKSLFDLLTEINTKAIDKELKRIDEENLKEKLKDFYKLRIYIYGSNGEQVIATSKEIFDKPSFPHYVNRISFDNTTEFQHKYRQNPAYSIIITFDFTKPDVFDWTAKPSSRTPNESRLYLEAMDQEWLEWAYNNVKKSIQTKQKGVFFWHRSHVYDLLLWLLMVPLLLRNIYKLEIKLADILIKTSSVFKTALYLYIFVTAIILFGQLFNYARWAFPYQEFIGTAKTSSMAHKGVIMFLGGGILTNLLSTLVEFILPLLP